MEDKLSLADLGHFVNGPFLGYVYYGNLVSSGFCVGKKWEGAFSGGRQSLAGWLEYSGSNNPIEPPYDFPSELPNWVNINKQRFVVGEGTRTLGPFSLQEVLYASIVVRGIKTSESGGMPTASISGGGQSVSVSNSDYVMENKYVPDSVPFPLNYLYDKYEWGHENYYGEDDDFTFDGPVVFYASAGRSSDSYSVYGGNLIIDIDNPDEYYIEVVQQPFRYSVGASCDGDINATDPEGTTYARIYSRAQKSLGYSLSLERAKYDIYGGISSVGESYTEPYTNYPLPTTTKNERKITIVSHTATLKLGHITKQIKLYGVKIEEEYVGSRESDDEEDPPPPPAAEITLSAPLPSITYEADLFWPFKNSEGQPVYNTTTGAIINSPIP